MPEQHMSEAMSRRLAAIIQMLPLYRAMIVRDDLERLRAKGVVINSMDDLPADMREALLEEEAKHA